MEYKATTTTTTSTVLEQMTANAPLKIGSRGTIGPLVRKEIEYFKRIETDRRAIARDPPQANVPNTASSLSRPSIWFFTLSWRRKKRRTSNRFFPSACSVVKVSEANRFNGISGFNYRILRDEASPK